MPRSPEARADARSHPGEGHMAIAGCSHRGRHARLLYWQWPVLLHALRLAALVPLCVLVGACGRSESGDYPPRVVIKFADGVSVSLEGRVFSVEKVTGSGPSAMTRAEAIADAGKLNRILARDEVRFAVPLFSDPGSGLKIPPGPRGSSDGAGAPDLRLYYSVILAERTSREAVGRLVRDLSSLKIVQEAYIAPVGEDPGMAVPRD